MTHLLKLLLILPIRLYQVLMSPLLPSRCRFYPTCSSYSIEAIQTHGPLTGSLMSIKRISKCHPLHPGGVDLVRSKH